MDNNEAVKIGHLEKNSEAIKVVRPKFDKESFPNAVILREGVDELTLREGEEGLLRTCVDPTKVKVDRWGPSLVDEEWHAVCQAIYKRVEGAEWENLRYKFVEINMEFNVRHQSGSSRAKTLRKVRDAKERGDEHYDQTSEHNIVNRDRFGRNFGKKHLQNPALALAEALRRVDLWDDTSGGSRI